jgi:DNA-binding NtrC family response regulator
LTDRKRVLVVDDEPYIRLVVGLNLYLAGMSYGEARNGRDALDKLFGERWDACILDLAMPQADGFQVLREMQAAGLLEKVPVIVLSARSTPNVAFEALANGAHEHLVKPFAPADVAQAVIDLIKLPPEAREERRRRMMTRAAAAGGAGPDAP